MLERLGLFERNIVVCSTNDDEINRKVALMAKAHGVKRVICRLESSSSDETLQAGIEIFSSYMSNKILLKGLIETPNMLNLLSNVETSLYEIAMLNHQYDQINYVISHLVEILSLYELLEIMNLSCHMVIHNYVTEIE